MPTGEQYPEQMDSGKTYKLKPYAGEDFSEDSGIFIKPKCHVCGHHLPKDQHTRIDGYWMHSDYQICLALIAKSGVKQA